MTMFVAAPLAAITGVRMSGLWPSGGKTLTKAYPVKWARAVHFPVMLYFVLFIFVQVMLVISTGMLRNLNHMYAGQDVVNWTGFWIFAGSLVRHASGAWGRINAIKGKTISRDAEIDRRRTPEGVSRLREMTRAIRDFS
jgi:hypothetical protein